MSTKAILFMTVGLFWAATLATAQPPTDVTILVNQPCCGLTNSVELRWTNTGATLYEVWKSVAGPFGGYWLHDPAVPPGGGGTTVWVDPIPAGANPRAFYTVSEAPGGPLASNIVGYVDIVCAPGSTPFGLPFRFWDVMNCVPQFGVASSNPSDVIGCQLTGGTGATGDRVIQQGGSWAYRTTTMVWWAGTCEIVGCMTDGGAFWLWNRHSFTQDMYLAGEVDHTTVYWVTIFPNTSTPLSFRMATDEPRSSMNLLTSGFTGGSGATSDRLIEQGGAWCYYNTTISNWSGALLGNTPGKAYWILEKHGNTWNYTYGFGP